MYRGLKNIFIIYNFKLKKMYKINLNTDIEKKNWQEYYSVP